MQKIYKTLNISKHYIRIQKYTTISKNIQKSWIIHNDIQNCHIYLKTHIQKHNSTQHYMKLYKKYTQHHQHMQAHTQLSKNIQTYIKQWKL